MEILTDIADNDVQKHNPRVKPGHYNVAPAGWREISVAEFSRSRFWTYGFDFFETRFILRDENQVPLNHSISVFLFHMFDGTGVGMSHDWMNNKIHYYAFGCDHRFSELSYNEAKKQGIEHYGHAWHIWKCDICGHTESHDSSD